MGSLVFNPIKEKHNAHDAHFYKHQCTTGCLCAINVVHLISKVPPNIRFVSRISTNFGLIWCSKWIFLLYIIFVMQLPLCLSCCVYNNKLLHSVVWLVLSGWRRSLWLRIAVPVKTTWLRPWSTTCCQQTRELWWRLHAHAWGLQPAVRRYLHSLR